MPYVLIAIVIIAVVLVGAGASLFVPRRGAQHPEGRDATDRLQLGAPTGSAPTDELERDEDGAGVMPGVMPEVTPDAFPDAGGTGGRPG